MNYVPDVLDGKIINVQDPTSAQDVATKNYVDSDIKTLENKITGQLGPYCQ